MKSINKKREYSTIFFDPHTVDENLHENYYNLCTHIVNIVELENGSIILKGLLEFISLLRKEERDIINLSYGLKDGKANSILQISQKLGINKNRVTSILAKVLRDLRRSDNINKITYIGNIFAIQQENIKLNKQLDFKNKLLVRLTQNMKLESLGLRARTYNSLMNSGYKNVSQIIIFSSVEELMTIKNIGASAAKEIWNKLNLINNQNEV